MSFRALFHVITDPPIGAEDAIRDVAKPWLVDHRDHRTWLLEFAARKGEPIPPATYEDLWVLYALSRVNDILLTRQFPDRGFAKWVFTAISVEGYLSFMSDLGLEQHHQTKFSPFFHEIVWVDQARDPAADIKLVQCYWPPLMLGPMLFSRGGVRVSAGKDKLNKSISETSTMYWTYSRPNRPCEDLSVGWGHNSQWRTCFRRDYMYRDGFYLNVDADPKEGRLEELTAQERAELVQHRCFVTCAKPDADLFPYDEPLIVSR
jgi:hypothetical protein